VNKMKKQNTEQERFYGTLNNIMSGAFWGAGIIGLFFVGYWIFILSSSFSYSIKLILSIIILWFVISYFVDDKEIKENKKVVRKRNEKKTRQERLESGEIDGGIKGYNKYKKTYHRYNMVDKIKGKKVIGWKQVYYADDQDGDEFIPLFS
jgi:uncharacterized membrane protein